MRYVAGIDEAGRGPLAGPVTAACVCLPKNFTHDRITDSKKLQPETRAELFDVICEKAVAWSIVSVGPRRIERLNILRASLLAMRLSAERVQRQLQAKNERMAVHFLVDGNQRMDSMLSHETIVEGDAKELCIGAASILAKVCRDRLMHTLEDRYPGYGLKDHKGYPTKFHRARISELGPSRIHRATFAGVVEFLPGYYRAIPQNLF